MKYLSIFLSVFIFSCTAAYDKKHDSLQQYTGKFKFAEGSPVQEINITLENGVLVMNASIGTASLEKKGEDEFLIPSYSGTAVFKRNEAKKIIGIHIEAGGAILDGTKDEGNNIKRIKEEKIPEPVPLIPILEF